MKKNKLLFFSLTGLCAIVVGMNVVGQKSSAISAEVHGAGCTWEHYSAVEADYFNSGSKEYWVCCEHHESVFEAPTVGTVNAVRTPEASFVSSLSESDPRYAPKLEADHVIELKVNKIQSSAGRHTLGTREAYEGLESIEADFKWENVTKMGGWYGWGVSTNIATADIYTGMKTFGIANDGEWHSYTLDLSSVSGANYLYFIAAVGEFNDEATMCIRNIKIKYSGHTVEEPANGTLTYWRSWVNDTYDNLTDSKTGTLKVTSRAHEGTAGDRCAVISTDKYSPDAGKIAFRTKASYQGVNTLKFDYKIVGGKKSSSPWLGFGYASSFEALSVYDCFGTSNGNNGATNQLGGTVQYGADWQSLTVEANGNGYIYFFLAVGEFSEGTKIYFDNFEVGYFWNNSYVKETFDTDCALFETVSTVRGDVWTTVAR